ncbi:MAG: outer-membrane lipoprotein carrier protein LolA [Sandaracinaceae bacterium]|nr:outer-membrane lipoprotein carrier protein LolA [Sandaracinaceae bacterium]MDW8246907.1 outer-membrane lipoprotein carrier protein LolA [Sandaracinaceae bacterium]
MKFHSLKALFVLALFLLPLSGQSQASPRPEEVLASVQRFYEQTRTLQARFEQHFWMRIYRRTQSSRGTIAVARPGRIRFDYTEPRGKVIVSTPEGFIYYEPGENGGPGQYARGQIDASSAALGFLTGTVDLARDFLFALRSPDDQSPPHTDPLELRPRRPDPNYRRLILYVDRRPEARGVVHRVAIEDHEGNWNRFDFSEFRFNREIPPSTFRFDPPQGARLVELRSIRP